MEDVVKNALAIVNATRAKVGATKIDQMPKGARWEGLHCPLANALPDDAYVGNKQIRFADEESAKALAKALGTKVIHDPDLLDAEGNEAKEWASCSAEERQWAIERPWKVVIEDTALNIFVDAFDDGDADPLISLECAREEAVKV